MTGPLKVAGADTQFEIFVFAKVEAKSGKMNWKSGRFRGAVGQAPKKGVAS